MKDIQLTYGMVIANSSGEEFTLIPYWTNDTNPMSYKVRLTNEKNSDHFYASDLVTLIQQGSYKIIQTTESFLHSLVKDQTSVEIIMHAKDFEVCIFGKLQFEWSNSMFRACVDSEKTLGRIEFNVKRVHSIKGNANHRIIRLMPDVFPALS